MMQNSLRRMLISIFLLYLNCEVIRGDDRAPTKPTNVGETGNNSGSLTEGGTHDLVRGAIYDSKGTDSKTEFKTLIPKGGETHQVASDPKSTLTTQLGVPVADDQNSLKMGERGPTLLEDAHLREKIFHFDHERIPERVVHARGFGAHGYFETYESLSAITQADIFQRAGEKTKAFVRFSTVAGSEGSADLARDVRGFAVKLYTKEGNWDIVGNNIPVFFIQDAIKFPDLIHAAKPEPDRGFPQAQTAHDNFWDFISLTPESMNMIMWIMSDRTIPRSFRFMEGFGVHTFRFVNAQGKSTYVKFHWKPRQGLQSVTWNEAVRINGADPDFHRRDLWNSIQSGDFPEWELGIQTFDDAFADKFDFDILDATKLIPEELIPVKKVGRLVLNKVVDNFFAETEQVAFGTQNIVPGIDFTNDPLLQGRNFSYLDTQLKRLGSTNFTELPINKAVCPVHNFQQDGHMAFANPHGRANYEPNSWGVGPRESVDGFTSVQTTEKGYKQRGRSEKFADHYSQARQFFISQTRIEQQHIADALVFELSKVVKLEIREKMVSLLLNVDRDLAVKVANGLRLSTLPEAAKAARAPLTTLNSSPSLSILKNGPRTFAGRTVGIVVTDGIEARKIDELLIALKAEKVTPKIIATSIGGVKLSDGNLLKVDEKIDGGPAALYDAIVILSSEMGLNELSLHPAVNDFIADALTNHKFVGHTALARDLLIKAGLNGESKQAVALDEANASIKFVETCRQLRVWDSPDNLTREGK